MTYEDPFSAWLLVDLPIYRYRIGFVEYDGGEGVRQYLDSRSIKILINNNKTVQRKQYVQQNVQRINLAFGEESAIIVERETPPAIAPGAS